jgi:hypothetical protein
MGNFKYETSLQRDYTFEELRMQLTPEQVAVVDAHQIGASFDILLTQPVPLSLSETKPLGRQALINNTTAYADEVEDAIASDPVMEQLLRSSSELRGPALRARRTVVALALEWGLLVDPEEEELSLVDAQTIIETDAA